MGVSQETSGDQATPLQMTPLYKVRCLSLAAWGLSPHVPLDLVFGPFPRMQRTCWGLEKPPGFGWGYRQAWGPAGGLTMLISEEGVGESLLPVLTTGGLVGRCSRNLGVSTWFPCTSFWECRAICVKVGLMGNLGQGCQPLPLTFIHFTPATLTQAH